MRNLERRPRRVDDLGIRIVILTLAALLLMALQLTGQLRPLQSAITLLTSPAQLSTTGIAQNISNVIDYFAELRNLRQRNAELEQINSALLAENFSLREVEHDNDVLREFFKFAKKRPGLELRGAQIVALKIGQESTNFLRSIMLDLGLAHGIRVGMPVVTDQGLVGRISEVTSDSTSKVLLLTDPTSAVNAVLQSSRVNGVIRGTARGDLIMDLIPQGVKFSVGEAVLTSGLGGGFPKGIPIGQVIQIIQSDIAFSQQAIVRPTVDFKRLELVAVVTNFDPKEFVLDLDAAPSPSAAGTLTNTNTVTTTNPLTSTGNLGAGAPLTTSVQNKP
ncbi:MAG: rod shape-determining protein MreC [Caldilineaceae bacterium]